MVEEIIKFTKLTFIIHTIISVVYTIMYWLPDLFFFSSYGYAPAEVPDTIRYLMMLHGAVTIGFAISSLLGFLAKEWKQVKIIVIMNLIYLPASLIASFINFSAFNNSIYIYMSISIIVEILFCLTFLQQEEKMKPLLR